MMTVEHIAKGLDDRFSLLTGGNRTALPRHQTLRAAIEWSYELLPESARVLFRRLSDLQAVSRRRPRRQFARTLVLRRVKLSMSYHTWWTGP